MTNIRLTPKAKEDLKIIGRYTMKRWGKEQRNLYLRDLEKRFIWLSERPNMGKQRLDIAKGYYSSPQGEHVIFYLIGNGHIDIIGIPPQENGYTLLFFFMKSDCPLLLEAYRNLLSLNIKKMLTLFLLFLTCIMYL